MRAVLAVVLACSACRFHFDELGSDPGAAGDGAGCAAIPGLLVYLPMNAGDMAGSVLVDHSGNGRDGVIVGAATLVPGHAAEALTFPLASINYVDVGGLPLPTAPGAAVTVSLWFWR